MSIPKTLSLSLACALILAAHAAPSFAEDLSLSFTTIETSYSQQGEVGLWDFIRSWF